MFTRLLNDAVILRSELEESGGGRENATSTKQTGPDFDYCPILTCYCYNASNSKSFAVLKVASFGKLLSS